MKTPSKHAKKQKTIVMRESDIKKLERGLTQRISSMSIYIFLAWLKETNQISNDPDALIAEYNRLESWFTAIDDHLISVDTIRRIIENDTGMDVRVRKGQSHEQDENS